MRGVKSALALFVVLAGLGAYIYFVTNKIPAKDETKVEKVFPSIQPDAISALQIKSDKGPMSTQTLRGLANHGPLHWRGDRTRRFPDQAGEQPDQGSLDELNSFTEFDVAITGCPATTAINIGHIHEGATGVNGAVKISTGLVAGDLTLTGGGVTFSMTATPAGPPAWDAALITAIMANPAGYYVNFHSTVHGGGVIRGQLTKA